MSGWTWAAARSVGTSHEKTGVRIQDAFSCWSPSATLPIVALVSDGAGSSSHGGEGASLVCRTLMVRARSHFSTSGALPTDEDISTWYNSVRDIIYSVAHRRMLDLKDFAATSVAVFSIGSQTVIAHVGDGCAVLREANSGKWIAPSWPQQGEYAATTYFVTDDAGPKLRITRIESAINAFAIFSDGIERLVLNFAMMEPSSTFFEKISAPISTSASTGRNGDLSRLLEAFLGSATVTRHTDDDKSLVIAVLR